MTFQSGQISLNNTNYFTSFNLTDESVSSYLSAGDFSNVNDLDIARQFLTDKVQSLNTDIVTLGTNKSSLQNELNDLTSNRNSLNTEVTGLNTQLNNLNGTKNNLNNQIIGLNGQLNDLNAVKNGLDIELSGLTTNKNSLLGDISRLNLEVDRVNQTIENLNTQFQQGLASLIESKEDIIEDIKASVTTFQASINNVRSMFENPIVNLYVNNGAKKQIPFKKKIKLFLTLNGKEQWKSPPSVQYLTITGLVSSRQKTGKSTPEFKFAGRWKSVSKYFKPNLKKESDSLGGRWYLELDARKINDFPAGYWDEFVIRYDDPSGWNGEVFRWSWQDNGMTGVVGGDLLDTANELIENVNLLTDALDRFIDSQ
jgi:predicted  nucleic acid-binding Zn-ribbon protein